jgi:transposase
MYIDKVPNRNSPPAFLLRESTRDGNRIRKRTILNVTKWPAELRQGLNTLLKGGVAVAKTDDAFIIERSLPHGHVAAILGSLRKLKLDRLIAAKPEPNRDLVVAMIVARLIDPVSKLATARELDADTASTSLGQCLGLGQVDEEQLYDALDWLIERQPRIEAKLAKRHLQGGTLVLYDVSSSYLEGRRCELGQLGKSRDGRRDKLQIVYGLLCNRQGCPVAIEVFDGNTGDPKTLASQVDKLKRRFQLNRVAIVGDRGMITQARIKDDLKPAGLDWITALRAPTIKALVNSGALQLSLFDERDMAEISSPDFPGERLVACRNPLLATERARKRQDLLAATEKKLDRIIEATRRKRRPLHGQDQIGLAVGKVIDHHKMAKHIDYTITDTGFSYQRKQHSIDREAALDGFYVIRSSLPDTALTTSETVGAYKALSSVERAFRCLKTIDLHIRPIFHRKAQRVRAHVFLCMLAYYVEWHMRQILAPMLFDDDDKPAAEAARTSIVAPAKRSDKALQKAATKRTEDGLPVHSFRTLLTDLATLTLNTVSSPINVKYRFQMAAKPTPVQDKAIELLKVNTRL